MVAWWLVVQQTETLRLLPLCTLALRFFEPLSLPLCADRVRMRKTIIRVIKATIMKSLDTLLAEEEPGALRFGGARMVLFDVEASFWGLRRQLEALAGVKLADTVLQQAGANGGSSFARAFVPEATEATAVTAFRDCLAAYQAAGFGRFEIEALEWPIGRICVRGHNTFEAWMTRQRNPQPTDHPSCAYTSGILVGFINALTGRRDIVCVKKQCQAQGADSCLFELLPLKEVGKTAVVAFDPDPFLSQQINVLDLLFEQMPMGIVILDREFRLRRFNPTMADFVSRYSSLSAEQVLPGVTFFELIPGNEPATRAVFERVLEGETVHSESFPITVGGVVSYWDAVSTPLRENDQVIGVVHVTTNATERVRAQQRLQEALSNLQASQERLELALRGTSDGIWDWDLQTGQVYFSPRWKEMLGYAEAELSNEFTTWELLIHPDDREMVLTTLQAHLDGHSATYHVEHRLRHKNGRYRWVLTRGAALRDETGQPYRMAGSHTDITQRREAQDALQRRIAFEEIITTISNNFINMPLDEIDQGIYQALQTVGEFTGADRSYIFLYTNKGRSLSCIQEWCAPGVAPQIAHRQNWPVETLGWMNRQLLSGQLLQIPNLSVLPVPATAEKTIFQEQGIQSLLAVPMTYQEQVVGFLGFDAVEQEKTWTTASINLLKIVGEIFINALEHKRSREALREAYRTLEQRVAERTRELATLLQVSRNLVSTLELKPLLALILEQLQSVINFDGASVLVEEDGYLAVLAYRGPIPQKAARQLRFRLAQAGVNQEVIRRNAPIIISDVQDEGEALAVAFRQTAVSQGSDQFNYIRSWMGVPLLVKDRALGMLSLDHSQPGYYTDYHSELALAFANQVAVAIENARLYQAESQRRIESERRQEVAESLRDILRVLNSNQSLAELLDYTTHQARQLLRATSVMLRQINHEQRRVTTVASSNLPDDFTVIADLPLHKDFGTNQEPGVIVLEANQIVAVPDLRAYLKPYLGEGAWLPDGQRAWADTLLRHYRSFLVAPLFVRERLYGTMTFYFAEQRAFDEETLRLTMTLADQVSLAIENARLRESSEQVAVLAERNRLARELHDAVTQTLFSASLIADVLPRIWERSPETGRERLEELRELTRGALAEMRTLLLELRPATLTESSLSDLLQQLTTAVIGRSRLPVALSVEGEAERPLPPEVQIAFYRVAQEALNNVVKHAGAGQVAITLRFDPNQVTLRVEDDGQGFDPAKVGQFSLGLGIMRERAEKLSADLRIESKVGRGTAVCICVEGV